MSSAAADPARRTLIVGLGNPILGDDGVGWQVADALEARLAAEPALRAVLGPLELDRLSVGGLQLMERLVDYDRVVLIDAALDGRAPGTIAVGALADLDDGMTGHLDSAHDTTFAAALRLGARLGARLPSSLTVVTISAPRASDFAERLSPAVAAAVPTAVAEIIAGLREPAAVTA